MDIKIFDTIIDNRTKCISLMTSTTIKNYLSLIEKPYLNKGGIEEQREPLKTSSAIRIRKRMINDIKDGAVLPPIVVGILLDETTFNNIESSISNDDFIEILENRNENDIMIIDGMQRTTAIKEISDENEIDISNNKLRIEFWISKTTNSLIYRMLILNTGQVPWNMRRQIEVVFKGMINEIINNVPEIKVLKVDDKERRKKPGEIQANDVIDLYLAYGARKEKVNTKEKLADEFTRLDFIEATEKNFFTDLFYKTLSYLGKLDNILGRYETDNNIGKFSNGADLFKSHPARVGFVTAIAKQIFGRPGINKDVDKIMENWKKLETEITPFISKLDNYTPEEIKDFVQFELLNESISIKTSKIGDFEREFFTKAFETLILEKFDIKNMEVCWRAY